MSLDNYITLGRSGLRVSPLALGAMTFGEDLGWGASVADSTAIIDRYIELGGNFIDTANFYTKGHSEKIIGDHIGHDRGKSDRMVITTKFSTNLYPGDPNGGGSGRKSIIAACEQSLRRLRTDYIDLYWIHNWDPNTPIEETMAALHTLVECGKVRYIGVSDTPAWKAAQGQLTAQFRGWAPFIATQIEYSLAARTVEGELIPMARELGMGVVPWAPLAAGQLSGKYTRANQGQVTDGRAAFSAAGMNDKLYDLVDELGRIAHEQDSTISRVALAWVMSRQGVASTLMGVRTMAHLEDNVRSFEVDLTLDHIRTLDEISKPSLPFPLPLLVDAFPDVNQAGATVNGKTSKIHPLSPQYAGDHY